MSFTTGERTALRWLLAVAALGAGVQLTRNWRHADASTPQAAEALSRQLVAVDSAQRASARGKRGQAGGRGASGSRRRPDQRASVDAGEARSGVWTRPPARAIAAQPPTLLTVDVDVADATMLERLPRIGPALAARIVADRQAHGPFGTLDGLQRVRGIGPKLATTLAPLVTFSGIPRPSSAPR